MRKIRHFVFPTTRFKFEFQKAVKHKMRSKSSTNQLTSTNFHPEHLFPVYIHSLFLLCAVICYLSIAVVVFLSLSSQKKFRVGFVCLFFIFQLKYNFSGIFIGYLWKEIHVDAFSFSFSSSFFVCSLKGRASCALTVPGDNVRIY